MVEKAKTGTAGIASETFAKEQEALLALIGKKSNPGRNDLSWQWHEYRSLALKSDGGDSVVRLLPEDIRGDHHFICIAVTRLSVAGIRTVDQLKTADTGNLQDEYGNPVRLSVDQNEFATHLKKMAEAESMMT